MDKPKMRLIFFGTPEFAVKSLSTLKDANYEIAAVVTAMGKPAGRGLSVKQSAVYEYAKQENLLILQPEKLKNKSFISTLKNFNADLFVVVAFRMLPEVIWNMPPLGTINVHASLLPQYRGAAPINHAIINGETKTGVTTFLLQHEIDTGNILLQDEVPISATLNAGELHDLLAKKGAQLLQHTLEKIGKKEIIGNPQPEDVQIKHAPKINREFLAINPDLKAQQVYNHIRGLSPYPTAFIPLAGKPLKVFQAEIGESINQDLTPGTWDSDGVNFLRFSTKDKWINVLELQPAGKKSMDVISFLRGYRGEFY